MIPYKHTNNAAASAAAAAAVALRSVVMSTYPGRNVLVWVPCAEKTERLDYSPLSLSTAALRTPSLQHQSIFLV